MDKNKPFGGHAAAFFTAFMWGCTFISTKIILQTFTPIEILFFRFLLGLAILICIHPRIIKPVSIRQELTFALAGLCGVTLYYLMENLALTFTLASDVSVITSTAPFFTGILAFAFVGEEKPTAFFFIGFVFAIAGISILSFMGSEAEFNIIGTILAVGSSFAWAVYSLILKRAESFGYGTIPTTQRTFFYGLIFMLPALKFMNFSFDLTRFSSSVLVFNILFLGVGASAICFLTWGFAIKKLGAVKASVYIYLIPVVTVIMSIFVLSERLTPAGFAGIILTLLGLVISQLKPKKRDK